MADDKNPTGSWGGWSYTGQDYSPGGADYNRTKIDAQIDNLPPDALAWLSNLAEFGEWRTPTGEKQNVGEWIAFLSTDQGKGWWGALSPQAKSSLQPDYGEVSYIGEDPSGGNPAVGFSKTALSKPILTKEYGVPSPLGAAQRGSTAGNPVFSLPSLTGDVTLSAEHPYGYQPGGGTTGPKTKRTPVNPYAIPGGQSIFRESDFPFLNTGRVAPPARWLLY